MVKVAVILSGSGYLDGAEIQEAVLSLLALKRAGHTYRCFAPNKKQERVVNHLSGKTEEGERNCLHEAARIARGEIAPLEDLSVSEYDAVMIPGGFGVAMNLSDFGELGADCDVDETFKNLVLGFFDQQKPILATCITPALLGRIFQDKAKIKLTLGSLPEQVHVLESLGMEGVYCKMDEACLDEANKVYTTPCYMEKEDLPAMFIGIEKIVSKL